MVLLVIGTSSYPDTYTCHVSPPGSEDVLALGVPPALAQAVNLHREFMRQCRCWLSLVPLIGMTERQELPQDRLRYLPTVSGLWRGFFVHAVQAMEVDLQFQPKIGKPERLHRLSESIALLPDAMRLGIGGAVQSATLLEVCLELYVSGLERRYLFLHTRHRRLQSPQRCLKCAYLFLLRTKVSLGMVEAFE